MMSKKYSDGEAITIVLLFSFIFSGITYGLAGAVYEDTYGIQEAIAQCEAELPRNQHCEEVITA